MAERPARVNEEDLVSSVPFMSSKTIVDGFDSTIDVFRDHVGIPHVRATTVRDAFYGQGFVTTQDRLWHMDHDRRWAYGRLAEYLGENALELDRFMRRFLLHKSVILDFDLVNRETKSILEAYASGVNDSIAAMRDLPVEYKILDVKPEPWTVLDSLAVFKARHILMGVFEAKLWRARLVDKLGMEKAKELFSKYRLGPPMAISSIVGCNIDGMDSVLEEIKTPNELCDPYSGSNSWALSGIRTASGKPLIAGDPHRQLDTPNVYYQNHVACPDFDVIGLSFPGFPGFPHFGHNANLAWCVTHACADYQDLYIERFKDSFNYEFQGELKEADVYHEVIKVRDHASEEIKVVVTHHGPVIAGNPDEGHAVSFKYTGTDGPNLGVECILPMLKSRSVDEMYEAMRKWVEPCQNFVFGDVRGNIEYLTRGKLPIRQWDNTWLPVPGWTSDAEWEGFIPFDEMPRSRNPKIGYIVTANNQIVGEDYPYHIGRDYAPAFRARRIQGRLDEIQNATVDDMMSIHADVVSIPGQKYARLIAGIEPLDELSIEAARRLVGWDGSMGARSIEPSIYSAFRWHLNRTLFKHLLGPLAEEALSASGRGAPQHLRQLEAFFLQAAEENNQDLLPPGENWGSLLTEALSKGVLYLRDRFGDHIDTWMWGRLHSTKPKHKLSEIFPKTASLLDPPSLQLGGDGDTVLAGSYAPSEPFTAYWVSVARYVFDLSNWDNCCWVVPLGVSGQPTNPHFSDQNPVWEQTRMVPMLYNWEIISEHCVDD